MTSLKITATGVVGTGPFNVALITWTGAGTAADVLLVVDNKGNDVVRMTAPQANYDLSLSFNSPVQFQGLSTTTIGSGTATFYLV